MNETSHTPYSLTVKGAAEYFGFAPQSLYDMISDGKLCRGKHYLKVGKKIVIIRERFIEWLHEQDGSDGSDENRTDSLS